MELQPETPGWNQAVMLTPQQAGLQRSPLGKADSPIIRHARRARPAPAAAPATRGGQNALPRPASSPVRGVRRPSVLGRSPRDHLQAVTSGKLLNSGFLPTTRGLLIQFFRRTSCRPHGMPSTSPWTRGQAALPDQSPKTACARGPRCQLSRRRLRQRGENQLRKPPPTPAGRCARDASTHPARTQGRTAGARGPLTSQ